MRPLLGPVTCRTALAFIRHCIEKRDCGTFRVGPSSRRSGNTHASSDRGPPPGTLWLIRETKRSIPMFARILDFEVKPEKKEDFLKVVKNEVLPILKKQTGFLEILPFS